MITHPNCKINIGLNILARRPDGYHDIESLFFPVPLCDELEINAVEGHSEAKIRRFDIQGIAIDCTTEDNIVAKAYRLLRDTYPGKIGAVDIRLQKNIPFQAGLGGGSSDAAFALKMLNRLFGLGLDADTMRRHALRLGADCPFFIDNRPAIASGIGDTLSPVDFDLSAYALMIVKPTDTVSTKEAYANVVPVPDATPIGDAVSQPITSWQTTVTNQFERSVFPQHPTLAKIKQELYVHGALYASMSGSGSAIYALFPKTAPLHDISATFGNRSDIYKTYTV